MRLRDLLSKLNDYPFQPFRVKLSNNTAIDILDPHTMVAGPSSAIMPMETRMSDEGYYYVPRWRTVVLSHMVEFIDIEPPKAQTKKKRAS